MMCVPPLERMNSGSERTSSSSGSSMSSSTDGDVIKPAPSTTSTPSPSQQPTAVPFPVVLLAVVLSTWVSFNAGKEFGAPLQRYMFGFQFHQTQLATTREDVEWHAPNMSALDVHQDHWTEHSDPSAMPALNTFEKECEVNEYGESICSEEEDDDEEDEDDDDDEEEDHVEANEKRYAEHLVADIQYVETEFLNSQERLIDAMKTSAAEAGTILEAHYCFSMEPMGVSCAGELANEGRITFHTWPAEGVITMDLLTFHRDSPLPTPERVRQIYGVPRSDERPSEIVWFSRSRGKTEGFLAANNEDLNDVVTSRTYNKTEIASVRSAFQKIDIYDVQGQIRDNIPMTKHILSNVERDSAVERQIFLDGAIQSREFGEAAYHEALVHPALFLHPNPKRVAIVGGGEGATLREVLKHKSVEKAVMVEIDEVMVNTSRAYLPGWSDCSNIQGSQKSCFDDPRAEVYYEDAIAWFVSRFAENTDVDRDEGFDVIIMDALDPSTVVEFSDFLYRNGALATAFSNALGPQGILIAQVGTQGTSDEIPESLDDDDLQPAFRNMLQEAGFENLVDYQEAHCRFTGPWEFLLAMKNGDFRAQWHASEADWNLVIQSRIQRTPEGEIPLRFFDSGTMMTYQYPTRISETLWCLDKPEECGNGKPRFDPDHDDIPVSAFSIKDSKVPNAGRGVFTERFISKGSLMGARECVHGMFVPPLTLAVLSAARNYDNSNEFFAVLGTAYIEGYGWTEQYYGEEAAGVDPGILTFMNHGCHGTYNSGHALPFTESSIKPGEKVPSLAEYYEFYNPHFDRHYSYFDCGSNVALRDIQAGEEVLCNYLVLEGAIDGEEARELLDQVGSICAGQETGMVTNYEQAQQ